MTEPKIEKDTILVVDDTPDNLALISNILKQDYKIKVANSGEKALRIAQMDSPPHLILLDIMMPEMDGYEVCQHLKANSATQDIPIIFLTAKVEVEDEARGLGLGAVDYITKPINPSIVKARVKNHLNLQKQKQQLEQQNAIRIREIKVLKRLLKEANTRVEGELLGQSSAIRYTWDKIKENSENSVVMLMGPTGTGDEAIARAIHQNSARREHAFIHVDCSEMCTGTEDTVSSHYVVGSIQFELADRGTMYLTHIEKLSPSLQQQLLEVLQKMNVDKESSAIDVQIICYTTQELMQVLDFSPPLMQLLMSSGIIRLPTLKERQQDIPVLVDYFSAQICRRLSKAPIKVCAVSLEKLSLYSWPGNIRELQNVLERSIAANSGATLEIDDELLTVGFRIDRYRLVEKLAQGGMGEVWKAKHQLLARPAALKLIRSDKESSECEIALKRFQLEAQIIASLESPHTIKLYDYGVTENGEFYYVMELLQGMDLSEMVKKFGPLPSERVIALLKQVCRSLMEAHTQEVVHRDIKAANLFVCKLGCEYDFLKVLDFGIVKQKGQTQLTETGFLVGTPQNMAPELLVDGENVKADARSDIYAIGCTAYWMLTGQAPFESPDILSMLMKHHSQAPTPPSQIQRCIHADLEVIVLQCMEKKPEDRPQTTQELWQLLNNIECVNKWSRERAEEWWKKNVPFEI